MKIARSNWNHWRNWATEWRDRFRLKVRFRGHSQSYRMYLAAQLDRTLPKRNAVLQMRTRLLVAELDRLGGLIGAEVLCVGCRNLAELNHMRASGAARVIGVDLFSHHKDVQVMDMHALSFSDNSFDVVYSSHSLEHAYDYEKAITEMIRVVRAGGMIAVEVPIQFVVRGADLIDFKDAHNLERVFAAFGAQMLWQEQQPPATPRNDSNTAIARMILRAPQ